ncbi:sensor histidine kinase [Rugamonas apoptosis]|uniref:Histidine kinase n=1 Tax=Rugamonas apoptosis TaxID=2758570 RepID=A0A7W2IMY4_9BURK|nr:histidine kinase [Rugamonas apoptosis]MBA5690124.1 histidine kinase [Rugamonas apoptosis]
MKQTTIPLFARIRWYWPAQLAGWCCVPLFFLAYAIDGKINAAFLAICWWGAGSGLLLSDLWHRLLKHRYLHDGMANWRAVGIAVLLLGVLNVGVQTLGFALIQPFGPLHGNSLGWLPQALMFWWGMHLGWNIIYATVLALRRAHRFEEATLRLQILAKDAELRALQAQVNPHFFFNSMNSVRALVFADPPAAADMIDQLTSLMRYTLQAGQSSTVALASEMAAVENYLAIEKIRFEQRMRVNVTLARGLEQVPVPPMAVQTLVENAVKYGVEARADGSDIHITGHRHADTVLIEIANQGAIVPFTNSTQVGLRNTRQRLQLALGPNADLDLSERDGWVRATLSLPVAA